ncbi:MAG: hypothetical protein EOO09_05930 [Chitinophagaceae bacterium]|nr:MAG: hypothetical protein EOO09_05930 [Chitinophagaceae bacterium]
MKRTDHILSLVATALTSESPASVLKTIEGFYFLSEPRKTGTVSLGAKENGQEKSFTTWIGGQRQAGITAMNLKPFPARNASLQPHIAAAFAGPSDLLLEITTGSGTKIFGMAFYRSSSYQILPVEFITLIDSQPEPAILWDRAATLLLESNQLNNRISFEREKVREYLLTDTGTAVFETMASQLMDELQIEAFINNREFAIPAPLAHLVTKQGHFFSGGDGPDHVYLYSLRDVNAFELLQLVAAQSFAGGTWTRLNETIKEYNDPDMPTVDPGQWEETLSGMEPATLQRYVMPVCRSICTLCEEAGIKPLIPEDLRDAFGPDETDQKRASARSKDASRVYSLSNNGQPWEYYQFEELEGISALPDLNVRDAKTDFSVSLEKICVLAAKMNSPYEEAFGLALFLAGETPEESTYTDSMVEATAGRLAASGFSERAVENFRANTWMTQSYSTLGWNAYRISQLMALSTADVFGGMGSWNDEYAENDQALYEQLSAELFRALRNYFAVVVATRE